MAVPVLGVLVLIFASICALRGKHLFLQSGGSDASATRWAVFVEASATLSVVLAYVFLSSIIARLFCAFAYSLPQNLALAPTHVFLNASHKTRFIP